MDYWGGGGGGGGGQRVCWPHPLKLLGGLGPPPGPRLPTPMILIRIIGGAWPPWPPSSYAYDLNPKKKKSVCVCVWGGGGGGGKVLCGGGGGAGNKIVF